MDGDDYRLIKQMLREIVGDMNNLPLSGEVVEVDSESCSLKLGSGLVLTDVRIRATIDGNSNFLKLIPKKGSKAVAISITGDLNDLILLRADEIEKIEFYQDSLVIEADSTDGKVSVRNENASLHDLMDSLFDIITNLKVNTPSGPSTGILPDSVQALADFKIKFKQLLK